MRKPELLVPASSLEVLRVAVIFGADAVYIGGEVFSLRAKAKNFSLSDMEEGVKFAHEHGVKVYVTANIIAHNGDLDAVRKYFGELKRIRPDALIISDPAVFTIAKEVVPEIEIHISTQANNTNYGTYNFWHSLGAKRVVSARELSLREIKEIRKNIPDDLEIETFVHGAMCISYSGRCLLSSFFTGRDANRGACTHPCRWKYKVRYAEIEEDTRPGEIMEVREDEEGTYIFNSKDLCMIEHIPDLVDAGIDSFKIEGRMKSALYVATVARTYRKAIDDLFGSPEKYEANMPWYREQIADCTYRQFTTGFFYGKPDGNTQIYDNATYVVGFVYLGVVEEVRDDLPGIIKEVSGDVSVTGASSENTEDISVIGSSSEKTGNVSRTNGSTGMVAKIHQRNKFCVDDVIEIMKPDGSNVEAKVTGMTDSEGNPVESCPHAGQEIFVRLDEAVSRYDLLRRQESEPEQTK